jgi:hypothetical protein
VCERVCVYRCPCVCVYAYTQASVLCHSTWTPVCVYLLVCNTYIHACMCVTHGCMRGVLVFHVRVCARQAHPLDLGDFPDPGGLFRRPTKWPMMQ